MPAINFVEKVGTGFAQLRCLMMILFFSVDDIENSRVILEVPTRRHREEILMRLRMDSQPPFDPTSDGKWFGIPFEIKVKDNG